MLSCCGAASALGFCSRPQSLAADGWKSSQQILPVPLAAQSGLSVQVWMLFMWLCFKSPSAEYGAWHGQGLPMDLLVQGSLLTCLANVGSPVLAWGGRAQCGLSL